MSQMQTIDLPIIDVSPFFPSTANPPTPELQTLQKRAAESLLQACETYGAFHVRAPTVNFDKAFNAADQFFHLPLKVKSAIPIKKGGFTRGYIGIGGESGGSALEVKEAFSYGYNWDPLKPPTNPLQGPNVYPIAEALDNRWKADLNEFYEAAVEAARATTRCLALAMDLPQLPGYCEGGETISLMRIFRYYPYTKASTNSNSYTPDVDRIGSSPHTDWGFLTLIASTKPGLQMVLPSSESKDAYVTVNPVPGTFVVNAGDYLSLITRGRVVSPLHRVVTAEEERTSFVFFWYPRYEARIPIMEGAEDEGSEERDRFQRLLDRLSLFKDQTQVGSETGQNGLKMVECSETGGIHKEATNLEIILDIKGTEKIKMVYYANLDRA
ncbi:hypothetical protein HDV05_004791 [Chytridiales sp. JEL 0842]|nr:hypothetical protein HDV05_004791 [Chytridiales sp. JEL 0842]